MRVVLFNTFEVLYSVVYNQRHWFPTFLLYIVIFKYPSPIRILMKRASGIFEPFSVRPVEPLALSGELLLTEKDHLILEYLLTWGNEPIHVSAISRGVKVKDKSGRTVRSITRKHCMERCRYLEEIGILSHRTRKPPRGAIPRTPHFYLNEDIESFQMLVHAYLEKGSFWKKLDFMQSGYTYSAIERNITKMLVRWLIPDKNSDCFGDLIMLLVKSRMQRSVAEFERREEESEEPLRADTSGFERIHGSIEDLKSASRERVEGDIESFYEELGAFTEEQKDLYESIVKLSPTALHVLMFLPFPKLLEQYEELGFVSILDQDDSGSGKKGKQRREWRLLNRMIHEILFCTMMADLLRYPFLMMRVDKRQLFRDVVSKSRLVGLPHDSMFKLRGIERKARTSSEQTKE